MRSATRLVGRPNRVRLLDPHPVLARALLGVAIVVAGSHVHVRIRLGERRQRDHQRLDVERGAPTVVLLLRNLLRADAASGEDVGAWQKNWVVEVDERWFKGVLVVENEVVLERVFAHLLQPLVDPLLLRRVVLAVGVHLFALPSVDVRVVDQADAQLRVRVEPGLLRQLQLAQQALRSDLGLGERGAGDLGGHRLPKRGPLVWRRLVGS